MLKTAGVSKQKARYLKDLAVGFQDRRITPRRFVRQANEEIIASLVSIRGIGRQTAEMLLMFSLNRLDVLPVDALGIRKAVQRSNELRNPSLPTRLQKISQAWHPYETIACWYL